MPDEHDERHDAGVIEHELIERHDTMVAVVCSQTILAHNRAIKARALSDQRAEADLIARLTELYLHLI